MAVISTENKIRELTIVLSSRNFHHYGQLMIESYSLKVNMNSADEIQFEIVKNEFNEYLWDKIQPLKLVWVKELDEYFEIEVSVTDSIDTTKDVTGKSLCESELGQTILYNIEINTEDDIARDDYTLPTVFY